MNLFDKNDQAEHEADLQAKHEGLPYVPGSETSKAAAESMERPATNIRSQVLKFIEQSPIGATCDEVEVALEMRHQTASARVRDLARAGRIKDSGKRRKTRSGRSAVVWIARS